MVHGCQKAAFYVQLVPHCSNITVCHFGCVQCVMLPLYVVETRCHYRSNRVGKCRGSKNLWDAAGPAHWAVVKVVL